MIADDGILFYFNGDERLKASVIASKAACRKVGYNSLRHEIEDGNTIVKLGDSLYPINVFGNHNIQNMNAAKLCCAELGISAKQFFEAIESFTGAAKRLELLGRNKSTVVYKDFAHSPSKVEATTKAVKGAV